MRLLSQVMRGAVERIPIGHYAIVIHGVGPRHGGSDRDVDQLAASRIASYNRDFRR